MNLPDSPLWEPLPSGTKERPILNAEEMRTLRDESPELLWRLIPLFTGLAEKAFASMHVALRAGNGLVLSQEAHTLKGSAANFGAERLMVACQELETAGSQGASAEYEKLLEIVQREYDYVAQALKSY